MTAQEALLRRAVTISLFSWRRAGVDDVLDDADRKGWWGDSMPTVQGDQHGSRLWLLQRRTLDADTLKDAQAYAEEALAWMVEDSIVAAVTVTVSRVGNARMNLQVRLTEDSGESLQLAYDDTWSLINAL